MKTLTSLCMASVLLFGCSSPLYQISKGADIQSGSKFVVVSRVNDIANISFDIERSLKSYGYKVVSIPNDDNTPPYARLDKIPLNKEITLRQAIEEARTSDGNFAVIFTYSAFYAWKRWNFDVHTTLHYNVYNLENLEHIANGRIYIADKVTKYFDEFIADLSTKG